MSHTPAPWDMVGARTGMASIEIFSGKVAICELWRHGSDREEIANARLISAAPDLLEVLQFVVDRHAPAVADLLFGEGWVRAAEAAIAKATGEKS